MGGARKAAYWFTMATEGNMQCDPIGASGAIHSGEEWGTPSWIDQLPMQALGGAVRKLGTGMSRNDVPPIAQKMNQPVCNIFCPP